MIRITTLALILTIFAVTLTSCATLFSGPTQTVKLSSREQGTSIYVNEIYAGNDSVLVSLQKSNNYIVRGEKEACSDTSIILAKGIDPITFLNVFVWPGFVVDAVTGSWYRFQQDVYSVTPRC